MSKMRKEYDPNKVTRRKRSKHKAAEHLVKYAKSLISQANYYPKDGDQLWCVFDCDDNKDSELQVAPLKDNITAKEVGKLMIYRYNEVYITKETC